MSKGRKVWFRWANGQMQRVYIYEDFYIGDELCHRASSGHRSFVLKSRDYGKTWHIFKEALNK